jgi:hypothetical protein
VERTAFVPDVYQYLEGGFHFDKIEDLPDKKWLTAALDALWGCDEFLLVPIADAIGDSQGEVTYASRSRSPTWPNTSVGRTRNLPEIMINDQSPREQASV